jgi:predicted peptidase
VILDSIPQNQTPIDLDTLYVAGDSMGGYGTFTMLGDFPEYFTAAIVAPGAFNLLGEYWVDARKPEVFKRTDVVSVAKVPLWFLNTGNDFPIVNNTYRALKSVGANVSWTHYVNATEASARP